MWFPLRRVERARRLKFVSKSPLLLRKAFALLLSAVLGVSIALPVSAQSAVSPAAVTGDHGATAGIANPVLEARVETLLRGMTLEEKVGQLVQYPPASRPGPAPAAPTTKT